MLVWCGAQALRLNRKGLLERAGAGARSAYSTSLQAFFTDRLATQRRASATTVAADRDPFRLLLRFVAARLSKPPSTLDFADLDATTIGTFLNHLEQQRHNSVRTRNARLAAIHSTATS